MDHDSHSISGITWLDPPSFCRRKSYHLWYLTKCPKKSCLRKIPERFPGFLLIHWPGCAGIGSAGFVSPNFGLPAARKEIVPVLTTAEKEARRMKDDEKWMGSGFGTRHCVPGHLVHYILFQNKDPKNNSELLKRHPRLYVLFFLQQNPPGAGVDEATRGDFHPTSRRTWKIGDPAPGWSGAIPRHPGRLNGWFTYKSPIFFKGTWSEPNLNDYLFHVSGLKYIQTNRIA